MRTKIALLIWTILLFVYNLGIKGVEEFNIYWNVLWFCSMYAIIIYFIYKEFARSRTFKEMLFFIAMMIYPIVGFMTNLSGLSGDYDLYSSLVINTTIDIVIGFCLAVSLFLISQIKK